MQRAPSRPQVPPTLPPAPPLVDAGADSQGGRLPHLPSCASCRAPRPQMVTDMAQAAGAEQAAKKKREKKAAPEVPLEPTRRWVLAGGAVAGAAAAEPDNYNPLPLQRNSSVTFVLCCCRSSRNEGKVVSYRFEEERGPSRPPRDGPLVKGGCWG